jgi:hypothetical protein
VGYLAADPAAVGPGIGHDTERPDPDRHALCQPGRRPGNENLRAGLTEEVLSQLARFKELSVLGRETSRSILPDSDAVRIHRELGVRYVLEGSVRTAEHQLRVTGRLLDAQTGVVLRLIRDPGRCGAEGGPGTAPLRRFAKRRLLRDGGFDDDDTR